MRQVTKIKREPKTLESKRVLRPLYYLTAISLILAILKLWTGYLAGSSSLRSMGLNNTADFFYSLILILGMWVSRQPADSNHPEGHHRYESLVGVGVGILILVGGFVVQYDAFRTLFYGREIKLSVFPLAILGCSIILKIGFAWYLKKIGKSENSPALLAISRDQLGDILADFTVIFALVSSRFLWPVLDPIVAAGIGLFILKIGYDALRENVGHLTGRSAPGKILDKVKNLVNKESRFEGPYRLKTHYVGPRIFLSFVLRTRGDRSLNLIHEEEEEIRQKLLDLELIERVYIHLEPFEESKGQD